MNPVENWQIVLDAYKHIDVTKTSKGPDCTFFYQVGNAPAVEESWNSITSGEGKISFQNIDNYDKFLKMVVAFESLYDSDDEGKRVYGMSSFSPDTLIRQLVKFSLSFKKREEERTTP